MDLALLRQTGEHRWEIPMQGAMRVPAVIYGSEALLRQAAQQQQRRA